MLPRRPLNILIKSFQKSKFSKKIIQNFQNGRHPNSRKPLNYHRIANIQRRTTNTSIMRTRDIVSTGQVNIPKRRVQVPSR